MPSSDDRCGRRCLGIRVASSSRGSAPPPPPFSSRRCVKSVRTEEFRGARRTVDLPQGCEIILRSLWAFCLFCSSAASCSLRYC
ncbi:uncharacterized, partial [Tachysurus ichikawai]